MITLRESRTSVWETNRSLCRDPYDSSQRFTHHSHHSSSSSPQDTVCVLTDHQPINHQETELSDISEITEAVMVNAIKPERRARAEHYFSDRRSARTDEHCKIEHGGDRGRDTCRRDRRATHSTFRRGARSIRPRIIDHTGTPVESHTRHD